MAADISDEARFGKIQKDEGYAESPSSSKTGNFPLDQMLRKQYFTIHSRPQNGPDLWQRNKSVYKYSDAVRIAKSERKAKDVKSQGA